MEPTDGILGAKEVRQWSDRLESCTKELYDFSKKAQAGDETAATALLKIGTIAATLIECLYEQKPDFLRKVTHGWHTFPVLYSWNKSLKEKASMMMSDLFSEESLPHRIEGIKHDALYLHIVTVALPQIRAIRDHKKWSGEVKLLGVSSGVLGPEGVNRLTHMLPELSVDTADEWARHIVAYFPPPIDEAILSRAVRNRRGKAIRSFKKRFAKTTKGKLRDVSPHEFLGLPEREKLEIIDRSKRAGGEPLDDAKVETTSRRAKNIEAMAPEPGEIRHELIESTKRCLINQVGESDPKTG